MGQQPSGVTIVQHKRLAPGRPFGVQRHERPTGLEHRHYADHEFRRAVEAKTYRRFGSHTLPLQVMRQAVGFDLQPAIVERLVLVLQRLSPDAGLDMAAPQRHQVPCGKVRPRPLQRRWWRQQLKLTQRPRGVRGDLLRQVDQFLGKPTNTRFI